MSSPQVQLLRDVSELINERAENATYEGPFDTPLFQYFLAEWFENEADQIEGTPYMVDHDWIERNYRTVLGAARSYLGVYGEQ